MNYLDRLKVCTADIRRELDQKLSDGFTANEIGDAARDVAAVWETSLKGCGRTWSGRSLFLMNADLSALGWQGLRPLDGLRKINNDAKHGHVNATAHEVLHELTQLEGSIALLGPLVPELKTEFRAYRQRQIICAIYDYFAQGETEFSFLNASPEDTWQSVRRIDNFQINAQYDGAVRSQLEQLPGWEYAPEAFAGLSASLRESDSEFWRLATFTCPYPDAQQILAPYQHNRGLLPGLHHDDDRKNVLASFAIAQSQAWTTSREFLTPHDLLGAASTSGLTSRHPDLTELAEALTGVLLAASPKSGPVTVDRASLTTFAREVERGPAGLDASLGVLVTPEGVVFVLA